MNKNKILEIIKIYFIMSIGAAIVACSYRMFYIPNKIVPGGLTGISTIIHYISALPIGAVAFALNIPIFLIGWKRIGISYVIRSLFATTALSAFIDLLPIGLLTDNMLLACIFGGVLTGTGLGIVFRCNSSTGGVDIVGKIINRYRPDLSLGKTIFIIDFLVIGISCIIVGVEPGLYAIISVFISQKATDFIIDGTRKAKAYYIVSNKYKEIAHRVMQDLNRGATSVSVKGMYSGQEQAMLLCIIRPYEIGPFLKIIQETDKDAFMFVTDIHEVMGEGFTRNIENINRLTKSKK